MNEDLSKPAADIGGGIDRLCQIVSRLRAPDGCPWDKVQTLESLKPCLLEECYELLDKMASDDKSGHLEELGDVLLQVVFQASIREEKGDFSFLDVLNGVCDKLVRRHPHVFSGLQVGGVGDVLQNWEKIKRGEGKHDGGSPRSALAGVPENLPSLLKAQRVQAKAARAGFEPCPKAGARARVDAELKALDALAAAGDAGAVKRKLGDVVFALVAHARALDVDAETALKSTTDDFAARYRQAEGKTEHKTEHKTQGEAGSNS